MKNVKTPPKIITLADGKPTTSAPSQLVKIKKRSEQTQEKTVEVFGTDRFTLLYRLKENGIETTLSAMESGYGCVLRAEVKTRSLSSVSICFVPDVRIGKEKDETPILENVDVDVIHADPTADMKSTKSKKGEK